MHTILTHSHRIALANKVRIDILREWYRLRIGFVAVAFWSTFVHVRAVLLFIRQRLARIPPRLRKVHHEQRKCRK